MSPEGHRFRILIADDRTLFRRGVRVVITEAEDMEVVAEAADGEEAVRRACQLRPNDLDLVLIDIQLAKLDGIEATRRIVAADPSLPVVILSGSVEEAEVLAAVRAGAVGFLSKDLSPVALIRALRDFHREGALPMSRKMAARLLTHLRSLREHEFAGAPVIRDSVEHRMPQSLTRREQQVLELIALGARDRDIAAELHLTVNTVKKHVKNILQKLGARNRAQAAAHRGSP
jgi:DNA-binding NarL/FixJ family response regulator